jgi:hypothetical protein
MDDFSWFFLWMINGLRAIWKAAWGGLIPLPVYTAWLNVLIFWNEQKREKWPFVKNFVFKNRSMQGLWAVGLVINILLPKILKISQVSTKVIALLYFLYK